jgi:hypothetical protein
MIRTYHLLNSKSDMNGIILVRKKRDHEWGKYTNERPDI